MKTIQLFLIFVFCFIVTTGNAQTITTIGLGHTFTYATDIAQDSNGNIYICDSTDDLIMKIDPNNKSTVISASNGKPSAITVDGLNKVYVAYSSPGTNGGKIYRMNNDGSNPILFSSPNTAITNLKFFGSYLWFTTPAYTNKLGHIYLNDGSVSYTNGIGDNTNATDFTFDSDGNSYFTFGSASTQVMKINSTFTAYSYLNAGTTASCIDYCANIGLVISGQSNIVLMNTAGTIVTNYSLPVANAGSAFLPVAIAAKDFQTAHFVVFSGNGYLPYDFKYPDNTFTLRGSKFNSPAGIVFDPAGNNIFVTDIDVNTGYQTIKKINGSSYDISNIYNTTNVLAGALSLTPNSTLYVADRTNNSIRSVSLDGTSYSEVITGLNAPYLARNNGQKDIYSQSNVPYLVSRYFNFISGWVYTNIGSGLISARSFDMDTNGNYYVADYIDNNIKKIASNNTTPGIGTGFLQPSSVILKDNYLYIADTGNNAIKRMNTDGSNIITIGSGFNKPEGICLNADGSKIFVADTGNNLVKIITLSTLGTAEIKEQPKLEIYPNPTSDFINIKYEGKIKSAEIFDMAERQVLKVEKKPGKISLESLSNGIYLIKIQLENGETRTGKIIKK